MAKHAEPDTIVAVATPPGRGGIGVVRVSGPASVTIAKSMLGRCPAPRHATYCEFIDAAGHLIDRGIALYFPAPHSYTGEDVLELQGHGGDIVLHLLVQAVAGLGARQARPGEFTERAFLNDRIDLLQAEAVADLIDSASASAARGALRSLQGEFSGAVNELSAALIDLRVRLEGALDFPDEDIDSLIGVSLINTLMRQHETASDLLGRAQQGQLLREGIEAVIVGRPNVGKSSLINRLVERDAAIVTDIPGTTRDPIRESCLIDGLRVGLTDTAGLRSSSDRIEQEGVRRATDAMAHADLVLWVYDVAAPDAEERDAIRAQLAAGASLIGVRNKIDRDSLDPFHEQYTDGIERIGLSALTGAGIDLLRGAIKRCAGFSPAGESAFIARDRHIDGLQQVREQIRAALTAAEHRDNAELIAEHLRLAQRSLDQLTGEFSADDLLGEIFARFCIGK